MEKIEELKSKMMEEQILAMQVEMQLKTLNEEYKSLCDSIVKKRDKIKELLFGGSK